MLLSLAVCRGRLVGVYRTALDMQKFPVLVTSQQSQQDRSDTLDLFGMRGFSQPVSSPLVSPGAG